MNGHRIGHHIVEGVSGFYHYHVAEQATNARALCGAATMYTAMNLEDWGVPFGRHFAKRPTWCNACAVKAGLAAPSTRGANE